MNPLTIPRYIVGKLLDTVFGKPEPFEFTGSTHPTVDKRSPSRHTV